MQYVGPIYRPPSEADSLLVQATIGCPHNKCAFCMVYKKGPRFQSRPAEAVIRELEEARREYGTRIPGLFLPAGDSLAMPADDLAAVCRAARRLWPQLPRITVYASAQSALAKGPGDLARLSRAGLTRLHLGLESGHGPTLARMKKGVTPDQQVRAARMALAAGLELSLYVVLGLAGPEDSEAHARATAQAVNRITEAGAVDLRLRTLVPKTNTLLLHWINKGRFRLCTPGQVLAEAAELIAGLDGPLRLYSDHYTNYVNLAGELPKEKAGLLRLIQKAQSLPREAFRPDFVGAQ